MRLIGVGVSNYNTTEVPPAPQQLSLFGGVVSSCSKDEKSNTGRIATKKEEKLDEALDSLRKKFGKDAVIRGRLFDFD